MSYKVTFTTTIADVENIGPAEAIEGARRAIINYGTAGYPEVLAQVEYTRTIKEAWSLRVNPDRVTTEILMRGGTLKDKPSV